MHAGFTVDWITQVIRIMLHKYVLRRKNFIFFIYWKFSINVFQVLSYHKIAYRRNADCLNFFVLNFRS